MSVKAILMLCAQALLVQVALSQCASRAAVDATLGRGAFGLPGPGLSPLAGPALAPGLAAPAWAGRCDGLYSPALEFTATSGGALPVTSSSAIAPTGISVISENVFEGALSVAGELPFVGTTGMEGAIPTAGSGAINHACGDGNTAMVSGAAIVPGAIPPIAATFGPAASLGPVGASFGPAAISPAAATFAASPLAGRLGLGGCGSNIVY